MSTKIFDAYLLPKPSYGTTQSLFRFSKQIRDRLIPASKKYTYAAIAAAATQRIDSVTCGLASGSNETAGTHANKLFDAARAEIKAGRREPSWDFGLEWTFVITPDGRVLLKLFAEREMSEAFSAAFPRLKDYHYQNSSDRPANINAKNWERRKHDWNHALPTGVYASSGLSMKLWGDYEGPSPYDTDGVTSHFPDINKRAATIAETLALDTWFKARPEQDEPLDGTWFFRLMRLYNSDEFATTRTQIIKAVEAVLIPTVTLELLRTRTSELPINKPAIPDELLKQPSLETS